MKSDSPANISKALEASKGSLDLLGKNMRITEDTQTYLWGIVPNPYVSLRSAYTLLGMEEIDNRTVQETTQGCDRVAIHTTCHTMSSLILR